MKATTKKRLPADTMSDSEFRQWLKTRPKSSKKTITSILEHAIAIWAPPPTPAAPK